MILLDDLVSKSDERSLHVLLSHDLSLEFHASPSFPKALKKALPHGKTASTPWALLTYELAGISVPI